MRNLSTWLAAAVLTLGGVAYAQAPDEGDTKPAAESPPPPKGADERPAETSPPHRSMHDKSMGDKSMMGDEAGKAVGISYPSKNDDINKRLSFVDLYLSEAANAAKTLSVLGDMSIDKGDARLVAEARKQLDGAIGQALGHLKKVRAHKADLEMIVPGVDTEPSTGSATARPPGDKLAKLDELEQNLKDARTAAKKISGQKAEGLTANVDTVSAHLMTAQQRLRDMAKWTSYTLLDDTNLGTVPVRGENETPGEIDRDIGKPIDTAPARPGETRPSRPEPVKPAPGGGH